MATVSISVHVRAAPPRVWLALTAPDEVSIWDGATPLAVPAHYPREGDHARWRARVGPFRPVLHDRIRAVEPEKRLASTLEIWFVRIEEEYRLRARDGGTELVARAEVRSHVPGLGWLATRWTEREMQEALQRLADFCVRWRR